MTKMERTGRRQTDRKDDRNRGRSPVMITGLSLIAIGILLCGGSVISMLIAHFNKINEVADYLEDIETASFSGAWDGYSDDEEEDEEGDTVTAEEDPLVKIGVLSIPSIGVKELIVDGSDKRALRGSLGHIKSTVYPGEMGNCAIAGHRNYNFGLYFNRLNEVKLGDSISVATANGTYNYVVTNIVVVEPQDVSVLTDFSNVEELTLITCTPLYIASHRLIVQALRVD